MQDGETVKQDQPERGHAARLLGPRTPRLQDLVPLSRGIHGIQMVTGGVARSLSRHALPSITGIKSRVDHPVLCHRPHLSVLHSDHLSGAA